MLPKVPLLNLLRFIQRCSAPVAADDGSETAVNKVPVSMAGSLPFPVMPYDAFRVIPFTSLIAIMANNQTLLNYLMMATPSFPTQNTNVTLNTTNPNYR
ncbi:hypothetical protein EMCG_07561 [[Emmonsia] crescens]|uniref:Uncharacterized protein n=1 Tax=[Emmonsia] crescens TaxID=73230 RepID=A0A0G2I8Y6_9EURO|nr:hypothetical protein EMCG_07561 [Emmonsia crescens UAMH 3008]